MLKMLILAHKICNTNISLFTLLLNYQCYLESALKNDQQFKTIVAQPHNFFFYFPGKTLLTKKKTCLGLCSIISHVNENVRMDVDRDLK